MRQPDWLGMIAEESISGEADCSHLIHSINVLSALFAIHDDTGGGGPSRGEAMLE